MLPLPVGREASPGVAAPPYVRHRPERTLLYQLVDEYYPSFKAHPAAGPDAWRRARRCWTQILYFATRTKPCTKPRNPADPGVNSMKNQNDRIS